MRSLYQKVCAVQRIYSELEKKFEKFREETGLGCPEGCSLCCRKDDIEAHPMEFLPFAYSLYKKGSLFDTLERLSSYPGDGICLLYNPFHSAGISRGCSFYEYRGLICRLFGYAARRDKHDRPELITCRTIKESQSEAFAFASENISKKLKVPVFREYYMQLMNIDVSSPKYFYPVNTAVRKSLEYVAIWYSYRGKRAV